MKPENIELLKRVHEILLNKVSVFGAQVSNAVYIPPAQALRNQADRMDYEEKVLREFGEFMKQFEKLEPFN